MRIDFAICVMATFALTCAAAAQTPEVIRQTATPSTPIAESTPTPEPIRVPAGTVVLMEFTETLSSRTSQTGQLVGLRLAAPLEVDGHIIADAGAQGGAEVIDAARSGIGGRNGKLIVSGRFLELGGQRVRIRGLQAVLAGEDNSREAVTTAMVPYVGIIGGFITGGEIEIPAGTFAEARIATDVVVPMSSLPEAAPITPTAPAAEQISGAEGH